MSLVWNGDQFFEEARATASARVESDARQLAANVKQLISTPGPPRSKPGESPHRDTDALYENVQVIGPASHGDLIVASIGSPLPQAFFTEFGTIHMAARPWLSRGLREYAPKMLGNTSSLVAK